MSYVKPNNMPKWQYRKEFLHLGFTYITDQNGKAILLSVDQF
jgi:hypothetical protein